MPWELAAFERTLSTLVDGAAHCREPARLSLHATLCASERAVDWSGSGRVPGPFAARFEALCAAAPWLGPKRTAVDHGGSVAGCVDVRRAHLRSCDPDASVVWLDPDVVFAPQSLPTLERLLPTIEESDFVVAPQVPRMWDESWDVLVHRAFLGDPLGACFGFDAARVAPFVESRLGHARLRRSPRFKFAGGWLTTLSARLLQRVGIPDDFRPYGWEDTWLMGVCTELRQRGFPVAQYVLEEILIAHAPQAEADGWHRRTVKDEDSRFNAALGREATARTVERVLADPAVSRCARSGARDRRGARGFARRPR